MRSDFTISDFGWQLSGGERAEYQRGQLESNLLATGRSGFILIGHSMGGLVSRRLSQTRPDLVRGVITIGTPHLGAYAASFARTEVEHQITLVAGYLQEGCPQGTVQSTAKCFLGVILGFLRDDLGHWFESIYEAPGLPDLKPVQLVSNPFLTQLNGQVDPGIRVGIQSYTPRRWSEFRLLGDNGLNCPGPEASCGGRNLARWAGRTYTISKVCFIVGILINSGPLAQSCHAVYTGMDFIDDEWNLVTAGPDPLSDGLVQGGSQVYPSADENFPIFGGDSHAGEPRSPLTRTRLQQALDVRFHVARR